MIPARVVAIAIGFVVAHPPGAAAEAVQTTSPNSATLSKKALYLATKQRPADATQPRVSPQRVGARPAPTLSLYNTWTHEWLALDAGPRADLPDRAVIDRFLRCHFTNQPTTMDERLAKVLRDAARHFRTFRVDIVSGFRAPKYNLMLRKKGHEVARDSQHTHGEAVDFRLPGVNTRALEKWARGLRLGGVGMYLESGFVHVDTGPIRRWGGT